MNQLKLTEPCFFFLEHGAFEFYVELFHVLCTNPVSQYFVAAFTSVKQDVIFILHIWWDLMSLLLGCLLLTISFLLSLTVSVL
jgi:hypothetical protein